MTKLTKDQKRKFVKHYTEDGKARTIICTIRYDDQCGNGHNSFSVTGVILRGTFKTDINVHDRYWDSCGCIHNDIEKHFPELSQYIKWHFMSSDEPIHYIANTLYQAQDTDYNGLRKGEYSAYQLHVVSDAVPSLKPVTLYKTGQIYTNNQSNKNLHRSNEKENALLNEFTRGLMVDYELIKVNSEYSLSKGKESDIEAARRCAIWPEATLEQLLDETALKERLPSIVEAFRADVEKLEFVF